MKRNRFKPMQRCFTVTATLLLVLVVEVSAMCKQMLLQKPVKTATCESICHDVTHNMSLKKTECDLRFLVILPSNVDEIEAVQQRVMPVLELAREAIQKEQILPEYVNIVFEHHDDNCDQSLATIAVIDSFNGENKKCAHAILGPSCDYPTGAILVSFNSIFKLTMTRRFITSPFHSTRMIVTCSHCQSYRQVSSVWRHSRTNNSRLLLWVHQAKKDVRWWVLYADTNGISQLWTDGTIHDWSHAEVSLLFTFTSQQESAIS